ncbi:hypothetical protein LSTR_LSTR016539 [Laodelphax striatellus]|uniref:Uncharacterized protein n=1 Tax=Laodelphax striatellus TaxID=195883 RepID=A0A482XIL5_LAOST|nr:hypothetical protein LSTR_LSTR016539 [Laodelphax striatellus]
MCDMGVNTPISSTATPGAMPNTPIELPSYEELLKENEILCRALDRLERERSAAVDGAAECEISLLKLRDADMNIISPIERSMQNGSAAVKLEEDIAGLKQKCSDLRDENLELKLSVAPVIHPRELVNVSGLVAGGVPSVSDESSRVTIFADSHGKKMVNLVSRRINCKVSGTIKPGAGFDHVTGGYIKECKNMTDRDMVVLMGGTNDMNNFNTKKLLSAIKKLLPNLMHVNVILMNIPKRYDLPFSSNIHYQIQRTNFEIARICNRFKNVKLLDVYNLGRRFYTAHGLHLNFIGKRVISDVIERAFVELYKEASPPIAVNNGYGAEEEITVITTGRPFLENSQPTEEDHI